VSFQGWLVFAAFWAVFVTTPGPNAVNCIQNGMALPFRTALWGVAAILTQATAFLLMSAAGMAALIVAAPGLFFWLKLAGAAVLIWLGLRAWRRAGKVASPREVSAKSVYGRALVIATVNAKSLAGYLAAFTQFIQPDVPIWSQMAAIMPTALTLTACSYITYTAIGAGLGKAALGAVFNRWFGRGMAGLFVGYGLALGASAVLGGRVR